MATATGLPTVREYGREEFLDQVWTYRRGEHVTFLGPTGSGKTYLAQQLIERTATPEMPCLVLVLKPKDTTVDAWRQEVAFKKVTNWPQPVSIWKPNKPPGYVLWPRHVHDPNVDDPVHHRIFRRAILDSYKKGNRILFADETVGLQDLELGRELVTVWRRGRSTGCAMWAASQTPTHIARLAYTQASHIFLAYIADTDAQKRLGEISGINTRLVRATVENLRRYQWLYIRQEDRTMCIINP